MPYNTYTYRRANQAVIEQVSRLVAASRAAINATNARVEASHRMIEKSRQQIARATYWMDRIHPRQVPRPAP